jgi:hypothetical protein
MYNQLQEHLNKYSILAVQFGFRTDSTTNKAIFKQINETLKALKSIFFILKSLPIVYITIFCCQN